MKLFSRCVLALALVPSLAGFTWAVEHRVEKSDSAPPADILSQEIASQLNPAGVKILRGQSRTVCEIWFCKQWEIDPAAASSSGVQYPFRPGQLIGVIRYPREGSDFRDQDIAEGVYTLRYGLQPVDGAHVGTFPTRDFLMLSKAEADAALAPVDPMTLVERSTEAAETAHPAILALLKLEGKAETSPTLVENEDNEWWILRIEGETKAGDKTAKLPVDLVVVGQAAE